MRKLATAIILLSTAAMAETPTASFPVQVTEQQAQMIVDALSFKGKFDCQMLGNCLATGGQLAPIAEAIIAAHEQWARERASKPPQLPRGRARPR